MDAIEDTAAVLVEEPADGPIHSLLGCLARAGLENAAVGLSEMIGQRITMTVPHVTVVPITAVPEKVGGAEAQVVGIYLASEGDLNGHIMLIMGIDDAVKLIGLLLGSDLGGSNSAADAGACFDALARSALAEAGNLTASFFLNAVSTLLGRSARPSPPAVIVDMAGAVLDIMLVTAGQLSDDVVLMETVFQSEGRELHIFFWVLPDLMPLRSLAESPEGLGQAAKAAFDRIAGGAPTAGAAAA
jgi:chemotaxis protein CheC